MNNKSIEKYIYENGSLTQNDRFINWKFNIYFEKSAINKLPGKYVFSDSKGYHIDDVGDRGGIVNRKQYNNIDDLAYDVYKFMVWLCARDYLESHTFIGVDNKELMENYQLELMKKINTNFYVRLLNDLSGEHRY